MCSITLRHESARSLLRVAASARLSRIGWRADVHVPDAVALGARLIDEEEPVG